MPLQLPHLMRAQDVAERLKRSADGLILLDVRTPQEWTHDGRIDGATLIPIDEIEERVGELPKEAEIIVYCHVGARSNAVANFLTQIGYANVSDMEGGIEAWQRTGLPVMRG